MIEISRLQERKQGSVQETEFHNKSKENKSSFTTIRCDVDVSDSVNALSSLLGFSTANEFLHYISNKLLNELTGYPKKRI